MGGGPEEVEGHSVICSGVLVAMASGVFVENNIKICPFFFNIGNQEKIMYYPD